MRFYVYVFEIAQDECVTACRSKARCREKSRVTRCLYVGSSSSPVKVRVRQRHKTSKHVRRGSPRIRWDLIPVPSSFESRREAERAERVTAQRLRAQGFTVFQA